MADGAMAAAEKSVYQPNEPITVNFSGFPGNSGDWITIIEASQPDTTYAEWSYLSSQTAGTLHFRGLPAGDYQVRGYFNWPAGGYTVQTRSSFRVEAAPINPVVKSGKDVYLPQEDITVEFTGFPGNAGDWITVVPAVAPDTYYADWSYLGSQQAGMLTFGHLPEGHYEVRGYVNWPTGGYTVVARYPFTVDGPGTPPAGATAIQIAPSSETVTSPQPTFRVRSDDATSQNRGVFEIKINGPSSRTVTVPGQVEKGKEFSWTVTPNLALKPGSYEWQVRFRSTQSGHPNGPWSALRGFTVFGGVDVAETSRQVPLQLWKTFARNWSFVIVNGWNGRKRNSVAGLQARDARRAGLKLATSCYLNFDNQVFATKANGSVQLPPQLVAQPTPGGAYQVEQALAAIGAPGSAERTAIQFMAIEVGPSFLPSEPDARMAIETIRAAVQAARDAGLRVVIHTSASAWEAVTGTPGSGGSTDPTFGEFPLWDTNQPNEIDDLRLNNRAGASGPAGPFRGYGPWSERKGKQFLIDNRARRVFLLGNKKHPVGVDVFEPALFSPAL